jgi:hypothetical protein
VVYDTDSEPKEMYMFVGSFTYDSRFIRIQFPDDRVLITIDVNVLTS